MIRCEWRRFFGWLLGMRKGLIMLVGMGEMSLLEVGVRSVFIVSD